MNIENSVALVTGANRGIGLAFVEGLLAAGASKVYAAVRDPASVSALADIDPARVVPVPLDVTNLDMVKAAASRDDVTLLINNAGVAKFAGLIADGYGDAARDEMETNYFGSLNMIRAFAPVLAANGGGAIVNMASIASLVNFPVLGSYSASKAAVHSMVQGVRAELAGQGTHVLGVYPGPVDTRMAEPFPLEKASTSEVVNIILDGIEEGLEDVYPDQMANQLHTGLLGDPKAIEKEIGTMLPG
jgi:NAD(P)-dependent dehydrogenase (short-subunit alcohol dehydrogenase family)